MSKQTTLPIFFPQRKEEIENYVETLLNITLKSNYETEKLLLFSFLNMMFCSHKGIEDMCPAHLLFLLQQTGEGDIENQTLVDRLFAIVEEMDSDTSYQQLYWYLKETDEFVPAIIRLISIFQFYDNLFPEPVYIDNGKTLMYYPKTKRDDVFQIPDGVEKIRSYAFYGNPYIEIIKIPKTISLISPNAISNCVNLTAFIVNKENENFYSEFGILYKDKANPVLVKYPSGIQNAVVTISKKTKTILSYAFENCEALQEVVFETGNISLNDIAFTGCVNLNSVLILDGKGDLLNQQAFEGLVLDAPSKKKTEKETTTTVIEHYTPSQIHKMFNDYIVGHENAKKTLSVAVFSHIMRCNNPDSNIGKSNIMLCGPTGCGKTEFARTIAKCLKLPFITVDATSITETGMKGNDPTDMLKDLLIAANNDLEIAQNGIIYIDEIDKLASFGENAYRESYSKGVQQGLLKIIEGGVVPLRMDNTLKPTTINFDTSNILFIVGGAFGGITSPPSKSSIGFTENTNINIPKDNKKLEARDFIKYGMTEEFVGRFPVIVQLQPLTEDEIYRIMIEPKNSVVEQYKKLVSCMGSELNFDDELLHKIASDAIKSGTGARGLRTVIERLVENIIYELPDKKDVKKVIVHKGMIDNQESAQYILSNKKTLKTTKKRSPKTKTTEKKPPTISK
jgi:ATP-dependent Clp protease ATP-binding subunit ClpX